MKMKTMVETISSNNIGKKFSRYETLYQEFNIRNFICHRNNIISILLL